MYNEDDKLEYVECTCTILAVRRKRRVEVKGENNILKCVGGEEGQNCLPSRGARPSRSYVRNCQKDLSILQYDVIFLSPDFLRKLRGFSKSFAYVGSVAKGNIG